MSPRPAEHEPEEARALPAAARASRGERSPAGKDRPVTCLAGAAALGELAPAAGELLRQDGQALIDAAPRHGSRPGPPRRPRSLEPRPSAAPRRPGLSPMEVAALYTQVGSRRDPGPGAKADCARAGPHLCAGARAARREPRPRPPSAGKAPPRPSGCEDRAPGAASPPSFPASRGCASSPASRRRASRPPPEPQMESELPTGM